MSGVLDSGPVRCQGIGSGVPLAPSKRESAGTGIGISDRPLVPLALFKRDVCACHPWDVLSHSLEVRSHRSNGLVAKGTGVLDLQHGADILTLIQHAHPGLCALPSHKQV